LVTEAKEARGRHWLGEVAAVVLQEPLRDAGEKIVILAARLSARNYCREHGRT